MEKFDFAALDTRKGSDAGFEFQVTHLITGEPMGLWIKVLGVDSQVYEATAREHRRQINDRLARDHRDIPTEEERDELTLALLAKATVAWRADEGFELDGQPWPPCTLENVMAFYRRFTWVSKQVDRAIHTRANFLKASAKA